MIVTGLGVFERRDRRGGRFRLVELAPGVGREGGATLAEARYKIGVSA